MRTAIDLHMKYVRDRLLVKTSCEIFNEAEQKWENNCGLGDTVRVAHYHFVAI